MNNTNEKYFSKNFKVNRARETSSRQLDQSQNDRAWRSHVSGPLACLLRRLLLLGFKHCDLTLLSCTHKHIPTYSGPQVGVRVTVRPCYSAIGGTRSHFDFVFIHSTNSFGLLFTLRFALTYLTTRHGVRTKYKKNFLAQLEVTFAHLHTQPRHCRSALSPKMSPLSLYRVARSRSQVCMTSLQADGCVRGQVNHALLHM